MFSTPDSTYLSWRTPPLLISSFDGCSTNSCDGNHSGSRCGSDPASLGLYPCASDVSQRLETKVISSPIVGSFIISASPTFSCIIEASLSILTRLLFTFGTSSPKPDMPLTISARLLPRILILVYGLIASPTPLLIFSVTPLGIFT